MAGTQARRDEQAAGKKRNKDEGTEALEAIYDEVRKWAEKLRDAINGKASGWHRLNVQVQNGKIKNIQMIEDEHVEFARRRSKG